MKVRKDPRWENKQMSSATQPRFPQVNESKTNQTIGKLLIKLQHNSPSQQPLYTMTPGTNRIGLGKPFLLIYRFFVEIWCQITFARPWHTTRLHHSQFPLLCNIAHIMQIFRTVKRASKKKNSFFSIKKRKVQLF